MCTIFSFLLSFICSPEQKETPGAFAQQVLVHSLLTRYVACVVCYEAHISGRARDDL